MRVRWMGIIGVIVALIGAPLAATGTVTVTTKTLFGEANVRQYTIAWTSASGAVSGNAFSVVPGHLQSLKCVPGTGGTQPSDQYDVTLVDANGIDVLNGQGANLSNTTGLYLQFNPPFYFSGSGGSQTLDLNVANAGNAKTGTCTVWIH